MIFRFFNRGLYWIRTSDPYPVKVITMQKTENKRRLNMLIY